MLLNFLKPEVFNNVKEQKDDWYLKELNKRGYDSTDSSGHVKLLTDLGIKCSFSTKGTWAEVDALLDKGYPVPVGWLHKGPESAPYGGGHWALIVGHNEDKSVYFVNDPYGEINLKTGQYGQLNGKMVKYSKYSFSKRWLIEGPASGYFIKVLGVK